MGTIGTIEIWIGLFGHYSIEIIESHYWEFPLKKVLYEKLEQGEKDLIVNWLWWSYFEKERSDIVRLFKIVF